ncbi:MAG TPA: hypothetical protein PK547_02595 [Candidatus Paceibacterota bacterium]|nr:hypothetical protein [Candidatus Paceibacterota bacterium]
MPNQNLTANPRPKISFTGILIGLGIALVLGGVAFGLWKLFQNKGVAFSFEGPNSIEAGTVNAYTIHLANDTRMALKNAYISIDLPDGVKWMDKPEAPKVGLDLGDVNKGDIFDKTIQLLIVGEPRSAKDLKATLRYQTSGVASPFQVSDNVPVILRDSLFTVEGDVPQQVLDGQTVPLALRWENRSAQNMDNVNLTVTWPDNFVLVDSNPRPTTGNNSWDIGSLVAGAQGVINLNGIFKGDEGATQKIIASLNTMLGGTAITLGKNDSLGTTLVQNPLAFDMLVNDNQVVNANPGDLLKVKLHYKNNYNEAIKNMTIKITFDGTMFDFKKINPGKGLFSSKNKTLTWNSGNTPSLLTVQPGGEGTLEFSLPVVTTYPIKKDSDQNFLLTLSGSVTTATPFGSLGNLAANSEVNVKINSQPVLSQTVYYRDIISNFANSGPLPLRADQSTTFSVHWKIKNFSNNLNDVKVSAVLPAEVYFTNKVAGNYGANPPSYDEATRTVNWTIPTVAANSGNLTKAMEGIFQVAVKPSLTDVNSSINFLGQTTLQATDAFTQQQYNVSLPAIQTSDIARTDSSVGLGDGIVRP